MEERLQIRIDSLADLERLGACIARLLEPGDAVLLTGDLGTGKTALTKALASGLGIDGASVSSPSFTIVNEYREGRIPLVHADLYRLGPGADLGETGLEDEIGGDAVVVIEWADYAPFLHVASGIGIVIAWIDEGRRDVCVSPLGPEWAVKIGELGRCMGSGRGGEDAVAGGR